MLAFHNLLLKMIIKSRKSQANQFLEEPRFGGRENWLKDRQGRRVILEGKQPGWSREFLELAGSARDFPYPGEPLDTELRLSRD